MRSWSLARFFFSFSFLRSAKSRAFCEQIFISDQSERERGPFPQVNPREYLGIMMSYLAFTGSRQKRSLNFKMGFAPRKIISVAGFTFATPALWGENKRKHTYVRKEDWKRHAKRSWKNSPSFPGHSFGQLPCKRRHFGNVVPSC